MNALIIAPLIILFTSIFIKASRMAYMLITTRNADNWDDISSILIAIIAFFASVWINLELMKKVERLHLYFGIIFWIIFILTLRFA